MLNTLDEIHKAYGEFLDKKLLEKMTGETQVEDWEADHEHRAGTRRSFPFVQKMPLLIKRLIMRTETCFWPYLTFSFCI